MRDHDRAVPFDRDLVDRTVLVMSPEYGSKLQLQKIAMLDIADMIVVNKGDLAGAPRAAAEVAERLARSRKDQKIFTTQAKRHRDGGVDALFDSIVSGLEPPRTPRTPRRKEEKV